MAGAPPRPRKVIGIASRFHPAPRRRGGGMAALSARAAAGDAGAGVLTSRVDLAKDRNGVAGIAWKHKGGVILECQRCSGGRRNWMRTGALPTTGYMSPME